MKHYSFYVKREVEGKGCQNSFSWNGAMWLSEHIADCMDMSYDTDFNPNQWYDTPKPDVLYYSKVKNYKLSRSWRKHLEW